MRFSNFFEVRITFISENTSADHLTLGPFQSKFINFVAYFNTSGASGYTLASHRWGPEFASRSLHVWVWVGFSRGFSRFPLPQISFHHFSTLISSLSFHFSCPCDGAWGVVGRHPCFSRTYNIGSSSHLIPRPHLVLDTSWGYFILIPVYLYSICHVLLLVYDVQYWVTISIGRLGVDKTIKNAIIHVKVRYFGPALWIRVVPGWVQARRQICREKMARNTMFIVF